MTATTNNSGQYSLAGPLAGDYAVTASASPYQSADVTVTGLSGYGHAWDPARGISSATFTVQ